MVKPSERFHVWRERLLAWVREKGRVHVSEVEKIIGEPVHPNLAYQLLSWCAALDPESLLYEDGELMLRRRER